MTRHAYLHAVINFLALGYLAGAWWPSPIAEGAATIIAVAYLIAQVPRSRPTPPDEDPPPDVPTITAVLRGGAHDGQTLTVPADTRAVIMPGDVRARWVPPGDAPDEMPHHVYTRQDPTP